MDDLVVIVDDMSFMTPVIADSDVSLMLILILVS